MCTKNLKNSSRSWDLTGPRVKKVLKSGGIKFKFFLGEARLKYSHFPITMEIFPYD